MTSTIEEPFGYEVAGEIVDRAQRHPYKVGLLRILAQGDRELKPFDLLGNIDQPLGITLDEVEALLLFARNGIVGGMILRQIDQLLVHDIAHEADAVVGIVVIDVAIDLVLVDMLGEQLAPPVSVIMPQ